MSHNAVQRLVMPFWSLNPARLRRAIRSHESCLLLVSSWGELLVRGTPVPLCTEHGLFMSCSVQRDDSELLCLDWLSRLANFVVTVHNVFAFLVPSSSLSRLFVNCAFVCCVSISHAMYSVFRGVEFSLSCECNFKTLYRCITWFYASQNSYSLWHFFVRIGLW